MAEPSERMKKLRAMLDKQPDDPFLVYGLGMEYKKAGDGPRAIESFDRTIQLDPGYCYAYFQKGQAHESAGDVDAARRAYRAGMEAATRKGDAHALDEIRGALEALE